MILLFKTRIAYQHRIGTAGVQYSGEQDATDGRADVEVDIEYLY